MALNITQLGSPNMGKVQDTLIRTAAGKAAMKAAQLASPTLVSAASRIFQAADLVQAIFGTPFEERPNPLLGGLTPRQVAAIQAMVREAKPVRKNLFCLRFSDPNPPPKAPLPAGFFDLLATDVSYAPSTLTGDKVNIGSAAMDKVTGIDPTEIQVTTIDDEAGSIKRWFDGKVGQVVNTDGTFNTPATYTFDLEVVHGIPHTHGVAPDLPSKDVERAFSQKFKLRPVNIQFELSRRDQALQEIQMTFAQVDTWLR